MRGEVTGGDPQSLLRLRYVDLHHARTHGPSNDLHVAELFRPTVVSEPLEESGASQW